MSETGRPNPDQLLAELRQQETKQRRGKLKIFFGMSAGVGKTYAMLEEARKRAAEGANVLIGYAEPHIRPDTESLLLGMEILPYRLVEYRGTTLKEFDLDAALSRRPEIVCVDELAHTNAPGMRHPKRWQDVIELLEAGINVYTTLNVQHLESVNDVIERVTGVRVRETLPDSVLEQADEVELIDIAPEELLERFREGRIYRPQQADLAAKHFFTKGNLIALRELALRKTAERVDEQMQTYRRDERVKRIIPTTERVLVCVGPSPLSARLIRSAKRLSSSLRSKLIAAYVESPGLSPTSRQRVEENLRLAEELGAQIVALSGGKVAEEILAWATANNVTKIVVGKPLTSRLRDFVFGSIVDDLIRNSGEIDIYVIRGEPSGETRSSAEPRDRDGGTSRRTDWRGYAWATGLCVAATLVSWPLYHQLDVDNTNILMLYLLVVLWVATRFSRAVTIFVSLLSVLLFDLIFVRPYYTLAVSDQQYLLTFAVMLLTALLISTLTHRVRAQADAARQRERRTSALLSLSRELSASANHADVARVTERHMNDVLGSDAVVLLADGEGRLFEEGTTMESKELGVAQWAYDHDQPAGRGTTTLPSAARTYVPLRGRNRVLGILGIDLGEQAAWNGERKQMAEAFAAQASLAVERAILADEARSAWERVEAESLRNTLLSGVSHELRTPLAGIAGAASTLAQSGDRLPSEQRREMLDTIVTQTERMDRLINNLLDMTRLESGGLVLKKDWHAIAEIIESALRQSSRRLEGRDVRIIMSPDLPLVQLDAAGFEQVVLNLIDNALQYTPEGSPIEISARRESDRIILEVSDRGPGLPPGTHRRVFEKFFRASSGDRTGRRGVGLGLALCRGIIELHGGTITAGNRADGGAVFRIELPTCGTAPQPPAEM